MWTAKGGGRVPEKTMSVHKGGGGVRGWSTWTKIFIYRVRQVNLNTFFKIAAIFAIQTLQRRVIRRWNGNFVGFTRIFSKIVKNVPMKQYLHFSGMWQK